MDWQPELLCAHMNAMLYLIWMTILIFIVYSVLSGEHEIHVDNDRLVDPDADESASFVNAGSSSDRVGKENPT